MAISAPPSGVPASNLDPSHKRRARSDPFKTASMNERRGAGNGICILSFDSGGPGTYSQLLILKEYMSRLTSDLGVSEDDVYPADHFDLMGGVGFGGLVALALGHFRMNINQAIDSLLDVAFAVFPEGSQQISNSETNSNNLKAAVEDMIQARQIPLDTKMNEPNSPQTRCKVVLYAATSASINHSYAFRTYSSRGSSPNPTIVEAICATISVPLHFLPVKIGPQRRAQGFIGGPFGANNPTRELLKEASIAFGSEKRVAQIISLGCGTSHTLSLNGEMGEAGAGRLLKEMAADCHTVARELSSRLSCVEAYRRFNVENGMENIGIDNWSLAGDIETHTRSYIEEDAITKDLEVSLRCLQSKIGTITLGQLNQSSGIKVVAKAAPSVSSHCVVRKKPLEIMIHYLVTSPSPRQRILPITGMGGCGKTQMVSYFLQEYPSLFTHVAFVDASSVPSIESDIQTWSRALGDGHERDVWEDGLRILSRVPLDERWALILDNADDPTLELSPFIPNSINLTVIITSRNRDLGNLSPTYHLELGEMEEDEALATLLQSARRDLPLSAEEMESARTLMKELGYLALALVQAGAYCYQLSSSPHGEPKPFTFTQYLSLFYIHRAELMKESQPSPLDSYKRGVYTTLDLSYKALSQVHREFLHFISFFHHADIPFAVLATAAGKDFTEERTYLPRPESHKKVVSDLSKLLSADGKWSELRVQSTIRTLQAFSLLSVTSIDDSIFLQLHPLIQAWSRDMVPSPSQHYRAMSIQSLTSCSGDEMFRLFRYILPHILDIISQVDMQDLHVNDLMAMSTILKDQGHYQKAAEMVETALERMDSGGQQPTGEAINATSWLAKIYFEGGKWNEAEKLGVQVLDQQRSVLGEEHLDTIRAVGDLAAIYWKQGRHSEAEKLDLEVLSRRREILGLEHPDTIQAMADLAVTYREQGRCSEAEKLELEVLDRRKKILGLEHPNTIQATANLASTYSRQGRHREAEELRSDVLDRQKKILGLEHPNTIQAAANLASTYSRQGRHREAEELRSDVLNQRKRILGQDHPETILAAANLAATYGAHGRSIEELDLLEDVVKRSVGILGTHHPATQARIQELSNVYRKLDRCYGLGSVQTARLRRTNPYSTQPIGWLIATLILFATAYSHFHMLT